MPDPQACKRELVSIIDSGSFDATRDARMMTEHFCAALSASDLDQLESELQREFAAQQAGDVPTDDTNGMNRRARALSIFGEAVKVLQARKKGAPNRKPSRQSNSITY